MGRQELILGLILTVYLTFSFVNTTSACVAFTAINGYRNGPYVAFKNQVTNVKADFRPRFGTFTATKAGLYFFTFTAISDNNQAYRVTLRKNRVPIVAAFSNQEGYSSASTSTVLYLAPGDIVYLYIEEGSIYEFTKGQLYYTSFSGFLIACDGFDDNSNSNDGGSGSHRGGYNGGSFGHYEGESGTRQGSGYSGAGVGYSPPLGSGLLLRSGHRNNGTRTTAGSTNKVPASVTENLGKVDQDDKIYDLLKQ